MEEFNVKNLSNKPSGNYEIRTGVILSKWIPMTWSAEDQVAYYSGSRWPLSQIPKNYKVRAVAAKNRNNV